MVRALIHTCDRASTDFLDEYLGPGETVTAFTSGSTGTPKSIELPKEAMRRSARATNAFFCIGEGDLMACPLSADYIAGKMMIVRALEARARLWMLPPRRGGILDGVPCDVERLKLVPVVPAQLPALLESSRVVMIDNVIIGGAPISRAMEARLRSAPFAVWATYGMTETCSHVALRCVSRGEEWFTPLPGVDIATDSRGCLKVNGMVTNDIVEIADGRFRWLGRADNVFISGGVKVHPEELEALLRREMPDLPEFYFTSRDSAEWGRETVMVVCGGISCCEDLYAVCRSVLPPAGVPKAVIIDSQPSFTSSGKLIRRRL